MTATPKIEDTTAFTPRFDEHGLIPAIVTDHATGEVLMFAFMNAEALELTIRSGETHFWSRSRGRIWKKGEESGNVLRVAEIRTDCDQDVVLVKAEIAGAGVACHTGARSCFYRTLDLGHVRGRTADGGVTLVFAPAKSAAAKS